MEYKTEFSFPLSEELLKTLGIDEDTAFETYYEDGRIRVRVLDEEEYACSAYQSEECRNDEAPTPSTEVLCEVDNVGL